MSGQVELPVALLSKEKAVVMVEVMMVAPAQKPEVWELHLVAGLDQG